VPRLVGGGRGASAGALVAALVIGACAECRERVPLEHVERLPYPSCGDEPLPEGEVLAEGHLRSGPAMRDPSVVERFEVRRRDCLTVLTVRQEWRVRTADVEAVLDADLRPLRVWKRMMDPALPDPVGQADIRLYELRTDPPTLTWRLPSGEVRHRALKGGRPEALIGPGRGLLTAWLWKAGLEPGAKSRLPVLDFRKDIEKVEPVTLHRAPDQHDELLGRRVRVYTVFGREPFFADDHDVVLGDMMGLRPHEVLDTPAPEPVPILSPPDPIHTP
jgi:hypothetical protein